ncbi:MAG: site-2 protease family protein [Proteobacteria bacterium]|nr:site-2 protease family protein [Pseudomonadota bacterium]
MTEYLVTFFIYVVPVLLAVTIHEVAHGWVAEKFGDPTARQAGRITLNPIKHLDLVGTLVFFITRMVGWAKPVPVNPSYFRNPRQDMLWVSAAGPAANLALAVLFSVLLRLIIAGQYVLPMFILEPLFLIARAGVIINLGLAVFNLLPVHPLDGSGIAAGLLPPDLARSYDRLAPYGFIILLVLIFTRAANIMIFPVIRFLAGLLLPAGL